MESAEETTPRPIHDCHKPLPKRLALSMIKGPVITHSRPKLQAAKTHLLSLHNEILAIIYTTLPHPRDQIAFTLTSRRIAHAIAASPPPSVVLKPGTLRYQGARWRCGHEHLLADLRRWSFIPQHLQLCTSCWKYLPVEGRIWRTRDGKEKELRSLKKVDWNWAVMLWRGGGRVCPACQIPEGYDEEVVVDEEEKKVKGHGEGTGHGVFVQAWGEGVVGRTMVVQRYVKVAAVVEG